MNCRPVISLVVPVYNRRECIPTLFKTLETQSFQEIEIVIIDDGSTDDTFEIVREKAIEDSRVHCFKQINSGPGAARNFGIEKSTGEFIAFLDSDDYYAETNTLEKLVAAARDSGADVVGGSLILEKRGRRASGPFLELADGCREKNYLESLINEPSSLFEFNSNEMLPFCNYQFDAGFSRFLYKRDFLNSNDIRFPELYSFEDPVFFVKAMVAAKTLYTIPDPVYVYRVGVHAGMPSRRVIEDTIAGIKENLIISAENGLEHLHWHTAYHRLDEIDDIDLVAEGKEDEILNLLEDAYKQIDFDLIEQFPPISGFDEARYFQSSVCMRRIRTARYEIADRVKQGRVFKHLFYGR